jgi:hypothetical protein
MIDGRHYIETFIANKRFSNTLIVRKGYWRDVFKDTDEDFGKWVIDITINGEYDSIADAVRDILLDKFFEERGS